MTEENQDQALESFAAQALRRNKPGSYEQLLCQHLIKAVASEPTEKIRLVCEAAMMVPEPPVDVEKLDIVYKVATSLTRARLDLHGDPSMWHGSILWGFQRTKNNFEKYILPWLPTEDQLYIREIRNSEEEKKYQEAEYGATKFWFISNRIHLSGLVSMEARFISWAMPETMRIFEALSKLVNPDVFTEMLDKVRQ